MGTERVELLEEEAEAPLDLAVGLRLPAAELVVEDDAALARESLERAEVVMGRARAAVEARSGVRPALAGDAVPRPAGPPVEDAFQLDHLERPVRRRPGARRRSRRPGRTSPPARTTLITPALRTSSPCSSRSSTAAVSPGLVRRRAGRTGSAGRSPRRPRPSPSRSSVPAGSASRSISRVVTFSPSAPGPTSKPGRAELVVELLVDRGAPAAGSAGVGSRRTRDRCFTVAPAWASPATPRPASRVIEGSRGLRERVPGAAGDGGDEAHRPAA